MPTAYVGDRTNTQAPSAAPGPEADITLNLPIDGEAVNASAFNQEYKALADFVDFLLRPQSATGDVTTPLRKYRDHQGRTRHMLDAYGFPSGAYNFIRDPLLSTRLYTSHSSSPTDIGSMASPWVFSWTGAASDNNNVLRFMPPDSDSPFAHTRAFRFAPNWHTGDLVYVAWSLPFSELTSESTIKMEFNPLIGAAGGNAAFLMGLGQGYAAPTSPVTTLAGVAGVFLRYTVAGSWEFIVSNGTSYTSYSIPGDVINGRSVRIIWEGSGDSAVASKAHLFADGVLIRTTSYLGIGFTSLAAPMFIGEAITGAGSVDSDYMVIGGPIIYAAASVDSASESL
jgi:hypothetical protein